MPLILPKLGMVEACGAGAGLGGAGWDKLKAELLL